MGLKRLHWMGLVAGAIIGLVAFAFFYNNNQVLLFLVGIAATVAVAPFVLNVMLENKREQVINDMFLEFTRNLAESVATGTPISKSIINMRKKNYGPMSPYVEKLANQIDLGIPIERALKTFGEDVGSPVVKRAIALIREAERAGGEIDYILDSTAKSISEIEKLKKERKAAVYGLVVQGYIIFFIFIGIILVMEYKILPLTLQVGSFGAIASGDISAIEKGPSGEVQDSAYDINDFVVPFVYLLLAQGFFAGLTIGKLAEGNLKAGIKHSFILMIAAYLISTGVTLVAGPPGGVPPA